MSSGWDVKLLLLLPPLLLLAPVVAASGLPGSTPGGSEKVVEGRMPDVFDAVSISRMGRNGGLMVAWVRPRTWEVLESRGKDANYTRLAERAVDYLEDVFRGPKAVEGFRLGVATAGHAPGVVFEHCLPMREARGGSDRDRHGAGGGAVFVYTTATRPGGEYMLRRVNSTHTRGVTRVPLPGLDRSPTVAAGVEVAVSSQGFHHVANLSLGLPAGQSLCQDGSAAGALYALQIIPQVSGMTVILVRTMSGLAPIHVGLFCVSVLIRRAKKKRWGGVGVPLRCFQLISVRNLSGGSLGDQRGPCNNHPLPAPLLLVLRRDLSWTRTRWTTCTCAWAAPGWTATTTRWTSSLRRAAPTSTYTA